MKTLIIAEKPDMGRNIAAAIEPKAINKRTHLEGEAYVITWAIGHLIGLAEPDHYDDRYKKWNFQDLPIIPDSFKLLPHSRTKDQLAVIKTLAAQCGDIVNACDAGREGQLIFSYIQQHLRLQHRVSRLWISDLTPETIRHGFQTLKDGIEYENLTRAARSRSEADWLIGMNGSRAFTTKHGELLSVGRVQTPVLALIYDRQKEIESFDSQTFYEIEAMFVQGETVYRGLWQGDRLKDKEKADKLAAKAHGQPAKIVSYEVKDTKEYPFKLYDLTLLQRDANARFGFSAKKTLDTAQTLYEKHKVISYPRTSSNYVNEQNIPEMYAALESLMGTAYEELARGADKRLVHKGNKAVCNPAKVEDHHAILPTKKKASGLSPDEQKVYDLIVRRFLSQFYPAAEYKVHTVMTEVSGELFKTTVKQQLSAGWKVLYPNQQKGKESEGEAGTGKGKRGKKASDTSAQDGAAEDAEEDQETNAPFTLQADGAVTCSEATVKEKTTQPPKHFNEGTLLKAMETAGRQIEDDELRDAMKDCGLGTPATRAATIERLKQVGYIEMQGKRIAITPKGRAAIELIRGAGVTLLASPDMTGEWERRLSEIARGQASDTTFMESVKTFTRLIVDKVRTQPRAARLAFAAPEPAAAGRGRGPRSGARGSSDGPAGKAAGAGTAARATRSGAVAASAAAATGARGVRSPAARAKPGVEAPGAGTGRAGEPAAREGAALRSRAAQGAADAPAGAFGVADCPRAGCGGRIFMGRKGYGCSHYRQGCGFVIWKSSFGKTLSDAMIKSLIEKGQTMKLKFLTDTGGAFEARLILKDRSTGGLDLERLS